MIKQDYHAGGIGDSGFNAIVNFYDVEYPHILQWVYWHERSHKTYLMMSEKYNDESQI